jgi:Tfp pilus assembly ATPase PilU
MTTMDQTLSDMVKANRITMKTALERCANPEDLRRLSGQI